MRLLMTLKLGRFKQERGRNIRDVVGKEKKIIMREAMDPYHRLQIIARASKIEMCSRMLSSLQIRRN